MLLLPTDGDLTARVALSTIFTCTYIHTDYPIFLSVLWKLEQGAALTRDRIVHMLWNEMPHLIVVEWAIYIPAQALNFRCIPVKFQVLFSNLVGIVWNGFLSGTAQHAQVKEQQGSRRRRQQPREVVPATAAAKETVVGTSATTTAAAAIER